MATINLADIHNMDDSKSDPYLARNYVRTMKYNDSKTIQTVTWNCWPNEYQYSYIYKYRGAKTYYGYLTGGTPNELGGILRYTGKDTPKKDSSSNYILNNLERNVRRGIFEGIRINKIKWKSYAKGESPSSVPWKTKEYKDISSQTDSEISMSSSVNGVTFDIEVEYELCTMGFPHREVPFFFFNRNRVNYMVNGSRFTDSVPGKDAGRHYSCVSNSVWELKSFEWGDPRATTDKNKTKVGWAYKNGHTDDGKFDSERSAWDNKYSFEYQTKRPLLTYEGWISDTPYAPQFARKSCYWTYVRTYKDSFVTYGIKEIPDPLPSPNKPEITVIPNHCSNDRRGEEGTVKVKYTHPNGNSGFITLYAVQINCKEYSYTKTADAYDNGLNISYVYSDLPINNGETYSFDVNFLNLELIRSEEVRYYAKASVNDPNYTGKSVYTIDNISLDAKNDRTNDTWNNCKDGHYFNEEPKGAILSAGDINSNKKITIYWDDIVDPDNDNVNYSLYVQRSSGENPYFGYFDYANDDETYGSTEFKNYCKEIVGITSTSYDLDMSSYLYGEIITVWCKSYDDYINSYYFSGPPIEIDNIKPISVIVTTSFVMGNETGLDNKYMVDGTKGKVNITYKHKSGIPGKVYLKIFQSSDSKGTDGVLSKTKILTFSSSEIDEYNKEFTKTLTLDFIKEGFTRSRDIAYYGLAIDENGLASNDDENITWDYCTCKHHFNDEPDSCVVTLSNPDTFIEDETAKIEWNIPYDPDGDTNLFYRIYFKSNKEKENIYHKEFYGQYIDGIHSYCTEYITANNYIDIDISKYIGDLNIWVESHDEYQNNYYYTGTLNFKNTGITPNKPRVIVYYAHGEEGDLSVQYSHPSNKNGYINLYAICEYLDHTRKVFTVFTDVYIGNGDTYNYTCYFNDVFGKTPQDRSCNIRYFATARTQNSKSPNACTVPKDWVPLTDMYEDWVGGHYFNEEPPKVNLILNNEKSNLYKNAFLEWDNVIDPDSDKVKYQVYLRAKSAVYSYRKQYTYFFGLNKAEDKMMYCDLISETTNNFLNIDLTHFETYAEEFDVWVRPWDTYKNSYYYNSDVLHFKKLEYSRPVIKIDVEKCHSEKGTLTVTYIHPDAYLTGEAAIDRQNTNGLVELYAYIEKNEDYPINITKLINDGSNKKALFKHNDSKTIEIDFKEDLNCPRSRKISYFAIARDEDDDPGLYSSDFKYDSVPENYRYFGHYYNGIPDSPIPYNGYPDKTEDLKIYDFEYTNICWDNTPDPDDDIVDYCVYLKTPEPMNEELFEKQLYYNDIFVESKFYYTRKYKIESKFNSNNAFESYEISIFKNNEYVPLYTKEDLTFRLNYIDNGIEWPKSINGDGKGIYYYVIESKDRYNNSYYNCSNVIEKDRKEHERPNKVNVTCTPAHGEKGDLTIEYSHPEDLDSKIYLYAFMEKSNHPILINVFDIKYTEEEEIIFYKTREPTIKKIKYTVLFTEYEELVRSNNICYYAIAEDTLVKLKSDTRDIKDIPYEEKSTGHYYNEEPSCTTPYFLYYVKDNFTSNNIKCEETPFNSITLVWKKAVDDDGDNINYNFYMNGPCSEENIIDDTKPEDLKNKTKLFYGNYNSAKEEVELEDNYNSHTKYAEGNKTYNYYIKITPNMINDENILINNKTNEEYIYYNFNISFFDEKGDLSIWIETDDNYENSYYRSGKILLIKKGHKALPIVAAYPRNYSTIYAKTPRIVIKLAEDTLKQEVKVYWKDTWYSNKNPEYVKFFSCDPKITKHDDETIDQYIVFRPPYSQTTLHHSKIVYAVKVDNTCTESISKWYEYNYDVFGYDFSNDKFIPLKSDHMNELRLSTQFLLDAYGKDFLEDEDYLLENRPIRKNDIVDNEDYNEIANPIRMLNDYINKVDNSPNMDDNSNVVIKYDLDLLEYEEQQKEKYITSDFKEWKILLYLLQNM